MALTFQQIVLRAAQGAKVPGFLDQAGEALNMVLANLAEFYNFDLRHNDGFTVTTNSVSPPEGPYPLPADYLRHVFRETRFIVNGVPYVLFQVPLPLLKKQFTGQGFTTYPQVFATDISDSGKNVFFWPPPNAPYEIEFPYYSASPQEPDPANSTNVPWFPISEYLVKATQAILLSDYDDDRAERMEFKAEQILTKYLKMKDDRQGYAETIKLDSKNFAGRGDLPSTKQDPF